MIMTPHYPFTYNGFIYKQYYEGISICTFSAAWIAIREAFPGVKLKGCAFHWSQAVWRHVQSVGLAEMYMRREGLHSFVRQVLALQFLPSTHIRQAVQMLQMKASTQATQTLIGYLRRQWLDNPVFPAEAWSVYSQNVRTNNDAEGKDINNKA